MINEPLHELFHDLYGAINGIDLMSQTCVAFIKMFNMEKLEGKFKGQISSNFKNIPLYYNKTLEKLKLVVDALAKIDANDIGEALENDIKQKLENVKEISKNSETLYTALLETDTKENLLRFAKELEKLEQTSHSMGDVVKSAKEKLIDRGKY